MVGVIVGAVEIETAADLTGHLVAGGHGTARGTVLVVAGAVQHLGTAARGVLVEVLDHLEVGVPDPRGALGVAGARVAVVEVEVGVTAGGDRVQFDPDLGRLAAVVPALYLVVVEGRAGGVGEADVLAVALGLGEVEVGGGENDGHREVGEGSVHQGAVHGELFAVAPVGVPPVPGVLLGAQGDPVGVVMAGQGGAHDGEIGIGDIVDRGVAGVADPDPHGTGGVLGHGPAVGAVVGGGGDDGVDVGGEVVLGVLQLDVGDGSGGGPGDVVA